MEAPERAARQVARTWACGALLVAVVFAVFYPARNGALLAWDDDINIIHNPHLRGLTWENLKWMFTDAGYMRRYVPLAWLSWNIDHALFGLTAKSCHVGNIVFHAANTVLVFLLVLRLLSFRRDGRDVSERAMRWAAAVGALFWAVHPLRVEVVAWASGRIYCQAGFFLLLATLAYLKAHAVDSPERTRRRWLLTALAACTASLLTYPLGVSYVVVLIVIDVCLLRRWRPGGGFWHDRQNRRMWLEKVPFLVVVLGILGITLVARFQTGPMWPAPPSLAQLGIFARAMQAFYVWAYYAWKPFVPVDLAPVYTTLVWFQPLEPRFVLSAAAVIATTTLLVWQRRRWPALLGLWICHLAVLVPVLGLTENPHYPNDRYSYLQGVLWSVAIAAALLRARPMRRVVVPAVATASVVLAALSWAQIGIWRDSETLFRYLHRQVDDPRYRADIARRLADVLRVQARVTEATQFYQESLALEPFGARAGYVHWGLAKIAEAGRQTERAAAHYRQAIALDPRLGDAYLDLGDMLSKVGRTGEALDYLRRGVALEPARAAGYVALARALADSGRGDEARAAVHAALRIDPACAAAHELLQRLARP